MEQQPLSSVTIRPITAADDPFIAKIIRTNFEQYHLTIPGTAYFDPKLDHLRAFYGAKPGRGYFVAVGENSTVLGFQQIDKPQGVQHGAMDHFYLKSL